MNGQLRSPPLVEVLEETVEEEPEEDVMVASTSSSTSSSVTLQSAQTLNESFRRNLTLNYVSLPPPPKLGISSLERAIALSYSKVRLEAKISENKCLNH